jgi:hypothetical protein
MSFPRVKTLKSLMCIVLTTGIHLLQFAHIPVGSACMGEI